MQKLHYRKQGVFSQVIFGDQMVHSPSELTKLIIENLRASNLASEAYSQSLSTV